MAASIELQTVTAGIHLRVSRVAKAPLFASLQDATHQCLTVMATTPEAMPSALGLPWVTHSANIQPSAAAAVAIWVTSIAMPAVPLAAAAEPALKPNQPTHSMAAPTRV